MRKFAFVSLIAMLFVAFSAKAQDYEVKPPTEDKVAVGAIGGTVDVTALGGASYSIPIQVPEGMGGMQPNLAISYNNQGGNGLLGWCWDLGGLSIITRTGTTWYHDNCLHGVCFSTDFSDCDGLDRFALDGQRLMVVNGRPDGADGAEYRTEVDQMAKIESYSCDTTFGPAFFKVWCSNGNIAYYGSKWHSRIGLQQRNDVCLWLLDSVVDRNGNYMSYKYCRGDANYFLTDIYYTGNSQSGVSPLYRVKLEYDGRPDIETVFIGNNALHQTKILKRISVFNTTSTGNSPLWQYDFNYSGGYDSELYHKLETVTFSGGGETYRSTDIQWENDNTNHYSSQSFSLDGDEENADRCIKFPGDFNGDGYDDLITVEKNSDENGKRFARVYLNGRDESGNVVFTQIEKYELSEHITWIYVADFDGDRLDDFMFANRKRKDYWWLRDIVTLDIYLTRRNASGGLDFISHVTPDADYRLASSKRDALILGDFLGEEKTSFILEIASDDKETGDDNAGNDTIGERADRSYYICYDRRQGKFVQHKIKDNGVLGADVYHPADYDGDGKTEILYSYPQNGYTSTAIVKLVYSNERYGFQEHYNGIPTNWLDCHPGDFNGDGNMDALFLFEHNDSDGEWRVYLFKQNRFLWDHFRCPGIPTLGSGHFSLDKQREEYSYLKVGDFNGDGCSDIIYPKTDYKTVFCYGPMRNDSEHFPFTYKNTFNTNYSTWFSNLNICIGNFKGNECLQLLGYKNGFYSGFDIRHVHPISDRYNVEAIVDGMSNRVRFEYDYLMPTLSGDHAADFYTLDDGQTHAGRYIFSRSMPIKALKKATADNPDAGTPKVETRYRYGNVMVHTHGHGVLGFTDIVADSYVDDVFKGRTKQRFSTSELGSKCQSVLKETFSYGPANNLMQRTEHKYLVWESRRNAKVFMPLVSAQAGWHYSLDGSYGFEKQTLNSNNYQSDVASPLIVYDNIVHCVKSHQCISNNQMAASAAYLPRNYKYRTTVEYEYDDQVSDWLVSRPKAVLAAAEGNVSEGNEDVKTLTLYDYGHPNHPTLPSKVVHYPSGVCPNDSTSSVRDGLATCEIIAYNTNGRISEKTLEAVSDNTLPTVTTTFEYTSDGQFLEKVTNTKGYVTQYRYDTDGYGRLKYEIDCNEMLTFHYPSPLGTTQQTVFPDLTQGKTEKIWVASDDPHAPRNAKYKEVSTQMDTNGEAITTACAYYDGAGRCLRSVRYGLNGEAIYTDTRYDSQGLVGGVSDPYFHDSEDEPKWTEYQYDGYGRLILTLFPDGTSRSVVHDGLTVSSTRHPATDSVPSQTVTKTVNVAGWLTESTDAGQNTVRYAYYADGSLKHAQIGYDTNTRVSMEYDNARNRTKLTDPDYGTVTSHYNAYGQLVASHTPRRIATQYQYDELGRLTQRKESTRGGQQVVTEWDYSDEGYEKGLLKTVSYNGGEQVLSYTYDHLNRVAGVVEAYGGDSLSTAYRYEPNTGRLQETTYPTGYTLRRMYTPSGHLHKLTDANGEPLWQTKQVNAMGQVTKYMTGNHVGSTLAYDSTTHRLRGIVTQQMAKSVFLQNLWYDYDDFGNFVARKDNLRNLEETFTYDPLDRLSDIVLNGTPTGAHKYDAYGRIGSKRADGQSVFDQAEYGTYDHSGRLKPHAISGAQVHGSPFPAAQQSITYTLFDKVATIAQSGNGLQSSLAYVYGDGRQRIAMVERMGGDTLREKRYGDHCEFVTTQGNGTSLTYLGGPLGVFAVVEQRGEDEKVHYVYKDHLGSWTTITNANGNVVREQSFDAWGNMRDPETWSGAVTQQPMFDRGFTGHEHLNAFGLINMNGRMYDPIMSSFLSVDNYVQCPDFSQNFNRYSYCLNNPLKYTDPSGWEMEGGRVSRKQGFYDKWGDYYSRHAYEPRDFKNAVNLWNMMLYGNLSGPSFAGGVGGDGGASASGGAVSMSDFQGTYGYHAAYQANSVYNYTFPSAKLQLIRNWQYSPSYRTNSDIRDAGITGLTVGVANYGNGYQKSYYTWTASGKTYSTSALDYVGRSRMDYYGMTIQPLGWYGNERTASAPELQFNSSNLYIYDGHWKTAPMVHSMQGGQIVRVVVTNNNQLGVTLQLQDVTTFYYDGWFKRKKYSGECHTFQLFPYCSKSFDFYRWVEYPYSWQFELSTPISDAANVSVMFYSDWVPGMPPSRNNVLPEPYYYIKHKK